MTSILNPTSRHLARNSLLVGAAIAAALTLSQNAPAATITKADNADDLNQATSWTNGVVPGAADVARWDANVAGASSNVLGADLIWKGIIVTNAGGAVTIGPGNTLTLGTSGITMVSPSTNLTISSSLALGTGHQVWNVATNRTLKLDTGTFTRGTAATLNVQGSGFVTPANITLNSAGVIGAWASFSTGQNTRYATINSLGNITNFNGTAAADATAVTDTNGTKIYHLSSGGPLGAGASFYALRYLGTVATNVSGNFTANGLMNAGTAALTLSGGATIGASQELVVNCANADMVFTGGISNNSAGASSLVKNGSGQLTVGNSSTYTGGTWVNEGTLKLNDNAGSGALGTGDIFLASGSQLIIRPGTSLPNNNITIAGSSVLSLSGGSLTMGGLLTLSGNASTTVGNSDGLAFNFNGGVELNSFTLTMGAGLATKTQNYTINGAITGTGGLAFNASSFTSGTITLTLGASNSFSGDTTISVKSGATGTATLKINNVDALKNSTLNTGALDAAKKATFTVAGVNTYNLGGLKGSDDLDIGANSLNIGANATDTVYAGIISGTGSIIKSGVGTLTLSNANTFTGSTTISNGTLALGASGSIASALITNYGTLDVSAISGYSLASGQVLAGTGSVIGSLTVADGATLAVGGSSGTAGLGTMAVTGDLTLNGSTVLRLNKGGTSDRITATGALVLGGTVNLNVIGAALASGDEFQIFSAGNSGTPTITGNPGSGLEWDSSLLNSQGKIRVVAGSNPPVFTVSLADQTVECGSYAMFYAQANGTAPLVYTWKINGTVVASGIDLTTYTTNNVHSAGSIYTVAVQVTNLVNSANSSCTLSVVDTTGPVITLAGPNPTAVLVGQPFVDLGATALDACVGTNSATPSGAVDTNTVGSYTITYTAVDGNGNTSTATRTVNVVASQDGIWTNTVGGTLMWMDVANWTNSLVAMGPNATADFGQKNIAANTTVRLGQPLTIGNMIFGDTSGSQTWSLNNNGDVTNVLTLDSSSGLSTVTVNADTTISLTIAGTNKLVKTGAKMLSVSGANSYSGGTLINQGTFKITATGADSIFGSGDVTIAAGQVWDNVSNATNRVWKNNFTIAGDGGTGVGGGDNNGAIFLNSLATTTIGGTLTLSADAKLVTANSPTLAFIVNGDVDLGSYTLTLKAGTGTNATQPGWLFSGNIRGDGGGGLTWNAASVVGMLTLSGTNSYTGNTTISGAGNLSITSTNALPGWDTTGRYSVGSGATLAVGNGVSDGDIATMLGTGNFAASGRIGFNTSAGNRTFASSLADTSAGALGITKLGNNVLTLSGANTYSGTTRISAGVLSIMGTSALPGWDTNGRYSVASGTTLAVGNGVSDSDLATMLGTTNFNAGASIGFDTFVGDRTYPGVLANTSVGSLGLTKVGNNTLTLSGVNTYSGATTVSAGTLAVNGTIDGGAVTVAAGATLAGYGQINGAVTVQDGGNLNLGSTVGTLTVSNALTFQTNSASLMKLAKGASPANDLVRGLRTVTFGGTLTVTTTAGMAAVAAGDSFQLFQATNYVGDFVATNLPSLPANLAWVWTATNGTLSIVAAGVGDPTGNPDVATTPWNVPLTLAPLANDTDPGSLPLTLVSVSPTNGTASISNGTNVLFNATSGFVGPAYVGYTITNDNGGTASSLITVTVTAPPRAAIRSVTRSGSALVLSGTNGAPYGTYSVLASTNVALALTNWVPVLTNTFDAGGHFIQNIPVTNTVPKNFFLLKQ